MLFGGRVAEEMVFGLERITTGAGNDIERATSMARRMVTQFGMSDVIGLMAVGDAEHEVFLGREIGHRRMVSEHTARQVDTEVKRILDDAHDRARAILEGEKDLMERLAEALLERETLDHGEITLLAEGKASSSPRETHHTRCTVQRGTPRGAQGTALGRTPMGGGRKGRRSGSEEGKPSLRVASDPCSGPEEQEEGPGPGHPPAADRQEELSLEETEPDRAPR